MNTKLSNLVKNSTNLKSWAMTVFLTFSVLLATLPNYTFAQNTTTISNTICSVVNQLQGPVAKGVAAFGIIFLGFSLFLGKISWGTALALGIGLGAIFGANQIVNLIASDASGVNACSNR